MLTTEYQRQMIDLRDAVQNFLHDFNCAHLYSQDALMSSRFEKERDAYEALESAYLKAEGMWACRDCDRYVYAGERCACGQKAVA